MLKRIGASALIMLATSFSTPAAHAEETAKLSPVANTGTISSLKWRTNDPPIKATVESTGVKIKAIIIGNYLRQDWSLLSGVSKVRTSAKGDFQIAVTLARPETEFALVAIGPLGQSEKQRFRISLHNYEQVKKDAMAGSVKRYSLIPSLGFTYVSYQQTNLQDLTEIALTGKISYLYTFAPPNWDIGLTGFMTLLPLTTNQTGVNIRTIGFNARIGYALPFVTAPWRLTLLGGGYYTTMMTTPDNFGYRNLYGPQIFPALTRIFSKGDLGSAYFKFSPVTDGLTVLSASNREIAVGFAWTHPTSGGHAWSLSADFANLSITVDNKTVNSSSASLSFGYRF